MDQFSNQKCPICKMELKAGQESPEGFGKKFCSEECKKEYQRRMAEEQSKDVGHSCCKSV